MKLKYIIIILLAVAAAAMSVIYLRSDIKIPAGPWPAHNPQPPLANKVYSVKEITDILKANPESLKDKIVQIKGYHIDAVMGMGCEDFMELTDAEYVDLYKSMNAPGLSQSQRDDIAAKVKAEVPILLTGQTLVMPKDIFPTTYGIYQGRFYDTWATKTCQDGNQRFVIEKKIQELGASQDSFQVWDDGTAYVNGLVVDNVTGCEVDGICALIIQAGAEQVSLVYAAGDQSCSNTEAATWVQWGKNVNKGTRVKAYGKASKIPGTGGQYAPTYELTFCDSKDYFILGQNDPMPVGAYTDKFFNEVAKSKNDATVNQFLQAKQKGNWIAYQDLALGYEFSYPATWMSSQTTPGASWSASYHDVTQKGSPNYNLTLGFISEAQLATMGITYCGSYPNDQRCQSLTVGVITVMIDWGSNANAAIASVARPQGGVVTLEIEPVDDFSKAQFLSILKTFKFISR